MKFAMKGSKSKDKIVKSKVIENLMQKLSSQVEIFRPELEMIDEDDQNLEES